MKQHKGDTQGLRLEVQALRAIAALMVVLYHLWPGRVPGGYAGVDVFFVISGFLITAHLLREVDTTDKIRLARFWARRARRLLPAAYLVLVSTAVATFLWAPYMYWQQTFREILASALYFQNWSLAADSVDYLDAANAPTAAQHYWTLSVEEQFYLVWPLLILLAIVVAARCRWDRRITLGVLLGALTIASFAYSVWMTATNPSAAYFVTPTRVWQFGCGALLALYVARRPRSGQRRGAVMTSPVLRSVWSWAGLAALAYCAFVFDSQTPFPGTAALVPTLGAVAVIYAGAPTGRLSPMPLLRPKPVQVLGDISYSLYLWHWPLIIIVPFVLGHGLGFVSRLAILIATIVLAWLTKIYVEDPIRRGGPLIKRNVVTFGVTALAAALLAGTSLVGSQVAADTIQKQDQRASQLSKENPRCFGAASMDPKNPCHNPRLDDLVVPQPEAVGTDFANAPSCQTERDATKIRSCVYGPKGDKSVPRVALVGDSHVGAMLAAFVEMANKKQMVVETYLKDGCAWSDRSSIHKDKIVVETCGVWRGKLQKRLQERASSLDFIVTSSRASTQAGPRAERPGNFAKVWRPLTEAGVPVVALRDNPENPTDPNGCLSRRGPAQAQKCSTPRAEALPYDALPDATKLVDGAESLDLTDFYCTKTRCPAVIGGVNVYRDDQHLSPTFTKTLAPYIHRGLVDLGLL